MCSSQNKESLQYSLYFFFINSGMAWNFRFSTVNKNTMPPTMVLSQQPHLDINTWLEMLDLAQYNGK